MGKANENLIALVSTGTTKAGKPTGYSYTTHYNKKNANVKAKSTKAFELDKFDPRAFNEKTGRLGKHVKFVAKKVAK